MLSEPSIYFFKLDDTTTLSYKYDPCAFKERQPPQVRAVHEATPPLPSGYSRFSMPSRSCACFMTGMAVMDGTQAGIGRYAG
jgi:hypothetical protein